jgi:hypothetical protein
MNVKTIFINIARWMLLIFIQLFLFRNLSFYNLPTAFIYPLFLLLLPFGTPFFVLYLIAFVTGLTIDSFYDTLGVHTTACVTLAFVRIMFIKVSLVRDAIDVNEPTLGNMGLTWFSLYALFTLAAHHIILFILETFKISGLGYTLGRALISTALSFILVLIIEFFFQNKKNT